LKRRTLPKPASNAIRIDFDTMADAALAKSNCYEAATGTA